MSSSSSRPSRRRALLGLPAAAAAITAPTSLAAIAPSSGPEDPVLAHYRDWIAARREWYRLSDLPNGEERFEAAMDAAEDREYAAALAMTETKPSTPDGLAALAYVLWDIHGPGAISSHEDYLERCDPLQYRLMAAIWRAASGSSGFPPNGRMEV